MKISRTNVALYSTVHLNFSFEEHHASVSSALQQSIIQDEIKVYYTRNWQKARKKKRRKKLKNVLTRQRITKTNLFSNFFLIFLYFHSLLFYRSLDLWNLLINSHDRTSSKWYKNIQTTNHFSLHLYILKSTKNLFSLLFPDLRATEQIAGKLAVF